MRSVVLHDESVNTHGFRMLTSGANLTEFMKNPVMLLNHNDWSMPIGRWEKIRIEGTQILADPVFDDSDPVGREVKRKWEADFIRAASIGSWAPEEVTDMPEFKLPTQTGPTVLKWTVREASVVTIPGNHNALAFYDRATGNLIDLSDKNNVIKLFDFKSTHNGNNMKILAGLFNLADTATENEVADAVRLALSDRDRLKNENATLTKRVDDLTKAEKARKSTEAIALIDSAIKDGRLDAKAKDSYIKLFDTDYDSAKTVLESLPKRQSIAGRIETGEGNTELSDLQKMTWEQLDKAGKLVTLRDKYPDAYKEMFKTRFGVEPNNV